MMLFCFCAEGPKGLVGLRWHKGMAECFGVDQAKAMGTSERKDNMGTSERKDNIHGNKEMERKDLSVTY